MIEFRGFLTIQVYMHDCFIYIFFSLMYFIYNCIDYEKKPHFKLMNDGKIERVFFVLFCFCINKLEM